MWNLAVEQQAWWRPGRKPSPNYLAQSRRLTQARAETPWLAEGSHTVQQQALRDFAQAMSGFFKGTHGKPSWRKADRKEGFRITGQRGLHWDVRRLNRNWGEVRVPKAGWVRFRWSRQVPPGVRSFRLTRDRVGHWHVSFASIPKPVSAPGNGQVVGVDRGVKVSAALSTGEMLTVPGLTTREGRQLRRLERKLSRARRGSSRRGRVKAAGARFRGREANRRKDWAEKLSTRLARHFDVIRVEDLTVTVMTYTSQRCSACGHVDARSRESQARFACTACGYACNADVNAARNIAAGHAVKARGGDGASLPVNREPQLLLLR